MKTNAIRGLTSIIVPCWNQLAFTKQCIVALKEHTRPAWELIVIDNGSTDGTAIYLEGARDMAAVPVTVVSNATNLGFPAAINQGLQLARGEYLVLLNNDVVVTDGWLDQLIALASASPSGSELGESSVSEAAEPRLSPSFDALIGCAGTQPPAFRWPCVKLRRDHPPALRWPCIKLRRDHPPGPPFARVGKGSAGALSDGSGAGGGSTIGLVGPMSNYAAPPQLVEGVPYRDVQDVHAFARRWRDEHRGQWFTVPKLSGFCLLLKRAVYDAVGGLDERFGLGFFDDDDLAERARRAGFELAVAHDLFVHHFGSRTFAGNGVDAGKLLDENARRFADKWGLNGTGGKRVACKPFIDRGSAIADSRRRIPDSRKTAAAGHDDSSAPSLPLGDRAKVCLTMIVKDEEILQRRPGDDASRSQGPRRHGSPGMGCRLLRRSARARCGALSPRPRGPIAYLSPVGRAAGSRARQLPAVRLAR